MSVTERLLSIDTWDTVLISVSTWIRTMILKNQMRPITIDAGNIVSPDETVAG